MWSMSMHAGQWGGHREGGFAHAQVQAVNAYRLTPSPLAYPLSGLGNVPWPLWAPFPLMWSQATVTPYTQRWAPGSAGAGVTKPANSGHPKAPGVGGGGGASSHWFLAHNPQRGCQGEDPDHRRASRAEPDLPDSVKGQRKRVKWEDHVPRVMAMGSFCRKEDNQPCWTQTSLNTDLEEEGGTLQAQRWETSMPGRVTAGDGAPAGRAGWGPAQGGPLGTEWGGRGGVQTGFRECWDPQAWEISLAFILRAVGIHSRVAGWRQCEWVNEWIWMNEWSPWKNFL